MKETAAIIVAILMSYFGFRYSERALAGGTAPVLAMWLLFCVAVSASMWTYWVYERPRRRTGKKLPLLITNAMNTVDLVVVWAIFVAMCFAPRVRLGFTAFELLCLAASAGILVYWRLRLREARHDSRTAEAATRHAHGALQLIMSIAYLPLFIELWSANVHHEPRDLWTVSWAACIVSLVPAAMTRNRLAVLYSLRALVLTSIGIALMLRIQPW